MKALITGGAGFIGCNLAKRLFNEGHDIEIWDDFSTGKMSNIDNLMPAVRELDINHWHGGHFPQHPPKFDVIFHLAAMARIQPSFDDPADTHRRNIDGTHTMLELARQTGARFVYAGSSTADDDVFSNPYAFSKWTGENYCKLYNQTFDVPIAMARFYNVYGPNQIEEGKFSTVVGIFERQMRNSEPLTVTGDGSKRRDFTHVDDIVDALIRMSGDEMLLYNCTTYNLGTGKNHSIKEIAEFFGGEIEYIPGRPGEAKDTLADIYKAKELLGWEPKVDIEDYIKNLVFPGR